MTDLDHRVQCIACAHYRAGMCHNAPAAHWWPPGKQTHPVGPELAVLKQSCPGYHGKKPLDGARNDGTIGGMKARLDALGIDSSHVNGPMKS